MAIKKRESGIPDPVWRAGYGAGFGDCRTQVLTFLEKKYIQNDDRPDRGSPQADAILQLARELAQELNG